MHIFIKKSLWGIIMLVMVFCLTGTAAAADSPSKSPKTETDKTSNDYVARVNDTDISKIDMERKFSLIKERYASMGMPLDDAKLNEFKDNILKSLIEQEVLRQESIAQGIDIAPEEVQAELDKFKKQFETEAAFQNQISGMNYSEDAILSQIKQSKMIQKFIDEKVMPTISVRDTEAKAYFDSHPDEFQMPERVHASHILLKVDANATPEEKAKALKKIKEIKSKIDKGEDFATLAKQNSDCPSSAKGGDLGFFSRGQMVKPFEETAFALKPGEVSDIVETRFGYHIIKVLEKETPTELSFEDVKEKLVDKLKKDTFKQEFPSYIESLKAKYTIEIPGKQSNSSDDKKIQKPKKE